MGYSGRYRGQIRLNYSAQAGLGNYDARAQLEKDRLKRVGATEDKRNGPVIMKYLPLDKLPESK